MESEVYVSCHAPSFSLLLFETVRSAHDQKGLLIGEICKEITSVKTDENERKREEKTTIYLEHCIPIKDHEFFGNVGDINQQKLKKYIDHFQSKVVGWYSFRRNTRASSQTLREILIHQSFLESIPNMKPDYFVAAFMSANVGANFSTHTYNHIFMRFHPRTSQFEPLKFKIYTMNDKIVGTNGYTLKSSFPSSKMFEVIINESNGDGNPVPSILTMNERFSEYLKLINNKLQEAERNINQLEEQIRKLKDDLSLNNMTEIAFKEMDKEPEMFRVQYLRFNSNIIYNSNEKDNPVKLVQLVDSHQVPDEHKVQNSNKSKMTNSSDLDISSCRVHKGKKKFGQDTDSNKDSSLNYKSQLNTGGRKSMNRNNSAYVDSNEKSMNELDINKSGPVRS